MVLLGIGKTFFNPDAIDTVVDDSTGHCLITFRSGNKITFPVSAEEFVAEVKKKSANK